LIAVYGIQGGKREMLVVADVNISLEEVKFLKEIEGVEQVVYVPHALRRTMPGEEIVKYALKHKALIVTRDKGFQYNPKKQWMQDYPSVLLVRHKGGLVKRVARQVRNAFEVYQVFTDSGRRVSGVLRRGKFRFRVYPRGN
jgi:predicted nuclease of predicted toxin-antitoxin system